MTPAGTVRGPRSAPRFSVPCLLLVAVALALPVRAQTTSATLVGTVRTRDGDPVAEAVVQARSEASGAVRVTITNGDGAYRIDSLSPGAWTVVARLADAQVSQSRSVRLRLQQTVQLDFTVGEGLTERVTVTAEAPLVDPRQTAGRLRVESEQVDALPLAGRVFTDLALLDSSVQPSAPGVFLGERGSVFTINGQSGRSNSFLVDGLDNNDQTSGTTLNSFYSQQVVDEFVLLTHQYAPEFGRASGGVLNIVTKRGGNDPGWDAFLQGNMTGLSSPGSFIDALPRTDSARGTSEGYQTGFTFGGPFKKDRAFYFLAYEHADRKELKPYTGVLAENAGNPAIPPGGRYLAPTEDDNLFFRTDFNLGSAHTLMLRVSGDDRSTAGINVGGVVTTAAGFRIDERDVSLAGSLTSVLSPTVIHEARFLVAGSGFDQFANASDAGVVRPSGIDGGNILNRQERTESRYQLVDNLTWRYHDHTLKFGVDATRSRTRIRTRFNPNGVFLYNSDVAFEPGDCGDLQFQDVDNADDVTAIPCPGTVGVDDDGDGVIDEPGNIRSYPQIFQYIFGEPEATLEDTRLSLFVQDHWSAGPRLVFDYGLRYDLSTFVLPSSARVDSTVPNGGAGRDTDNIAPRFGFTFTPGKDSNFVIRGGGGIFYDKLVLGFPAVASITSQVEVGLFFPQGFTWEVNERYVAENGIDQLRPILDYFRQQLSNLIMRFSTGTELETPYATQFNVGFEKGLGAHSVFGANVTHSQGYHLPLMVDLNPPEGFTPVGVDCTAANIDPTLELYEGLPCHVNDPRTGSIAAVVTEGRSWYSGLDVNWRWRRGVAWASASYTWSKAKDMGFDPLKGGIALPPDSHDLRAERGRADGDRRHRLVLSGDVGLPWMDLRLSGVWQLSTGLPYNVTTGIDDNADGIYSDRPDGVGRNQGKDSSIEAINRTRQEFNEDYPNETPLPPITSLDEPAFSQIDLRLYRSFRFAGDRGAGNVYFQVFNVLNRLNAGLIEGRAVSRNFGQPITLAGPPRTVEMGLKFSY